MLHTRFKAESPVLKVGSCHGTQLKVTGLSALSRKPNLDKLGACPALLGFHSHSIAPDVQIGHGGTAIPRCALGVSPILLLSSRPERPVFSSAPSAARRVAERGFCVPRASPVRRDPGNQSTQ